jgi:hypothetical protein
MSKRWFWRSCLALTLMLGCSSKTTVCDVFVNGGASAATGAPSSNGGAGVSLAGTTNEGGGAEAAAGEAAGGAGTSAAGANAAGSSAAGANAAGTDAGAGASNEGGAACGPPIPDVPPDCHATLACDASMRVVDQDNVPVPASACLVGTCNSAGTPGTAPAAEGTTCKAAGGGKLCDGGGQCVQCLHAGDCANGQVCSETHHCVTATCTDVDCGGACPPCPNGKKCAADQDCTSYACDAATLTCVTPQCSDHRQDGVETDADCGGDTCSPCVLGKSCVVDSDCASLACDAVSLICIGNQCADHRTDGNESDVDCGGGDCNWCLGGRKCRNNGDCAPGHVCLGVPKICQ